MTGEQGGTTTTINDVATRYERVGDGPPLVCIHGAGLDMHVWDRQRDAMAESFELIRYDLRGHGQSAPSDRMRYSIELFVDDLRALIERLDLDQPYLCGLSLGGVIAHAYASTYPIRGLVLAESSFGNRALDRFIRAWTPLGTFTNAIRVFGSSALAAGASAGTTWLGTHKATRQYARSRIAKTPRSELLKTIRAAWLHGGVNHVDLTEPVLVLTGEHSVLSGEVEASTRRQNRFQSTEIPDAGHILNMDNPRAFNQSVGTYLAGMDT